MLKKLCEKLCPYTGTAYRRGQKDTLDSIYMLLDIHNPCHDKIREEIQTRLQRLS